MKKVAVVILNWNGESLMKQFLPSVIKYTPDKLVDIIVVDNGSTDNSVETLRKEFPTVQIILLNQNYGFAEGYNRAIKQIDATYTVLLNSDVEVTPNWLNIPINSLESDPALAGVQPKILAHKDKRKFEYAGASGGWIDCYGYPFCRGRVLHIVEEDHGQYDTPVDIFWASGACFFVRTEVFKKEGGFDAGFFAHQEEIDFCWRLRSRGYRLKCIPQSVVYHVGGATLDVESPQKTFLNFRNNLLMIYKNASSEKLHSIMRFRFWLDHVAYVKFLITGHSENAKSIIQARKAFKQLKKEYTPVREENIAKTIISSIPEILPRSLILSFYLKGKKRFSEIIS